MFVKIRITLDLDQCFHFSLSRLKNNFNIPVKTLRRRFTSCSFNNIRPEDEQNNCNEGDNKPLLYIQG